MVENQKRPILLDALVDVDDGRHHVGVDRVHVHAQNRAVGVLSVEMVVVEKGWIERGGERISV